MPGEPKDKYANILTKSLVESAANTLTFSEIDLGLTIFQKVGIIINRVTVDWTTQLLGGLAATGDNLTVALTTSNSVSSISLSENSTIWKAQIYRKDSGTAANFLVDEVVRAYDLSQLPGGGELLAPRPLYGAIQGYSLGDVYTVHLRIYFRILELKPDEYFELLESRRFFG